MPQSHAVRVTVVVPVWREGACVRERLDAPELAAASEVIVVAQPDEAEEVSALARPGGQVRVIASAPGRAAQMNAGAAAASGDWLLFLHADSALPDGWLDDVRAADRDASIVGGAFRLALETRDVRARLIEWGVRRRIDWLGLPYGDQGLFVRRRVFESLGGFPELPIMEDVAFVRRLRRHGRLYHAARKVTTSARRWERDGWVRRTASNWLMLAAYSAGMSPRAIARWYARRSADAVVVLARDPRGPGKTRLWAALEAAPSAGLPEALLLDTLAAVDRVASADKALVHTGSRQSMTGYCPPGWTTLAQRGADLGERMSNSFVDLFARGHARAVLVGSDLPTLPERTVRRALLLLRRDADVVLGPAADGGFYLVGLHMPQPRLFEGIAWGTHRVLEQTTERARALGLRLRLVDEWYDVDDRESLQRAAADPRAVRTAEWVRRQPNPSGIWRDGRGERGEGCTREEW